MNTKDRNSITALIIIIVIESMLIIASIAAFVVMSSPSYRARKQLEIAREYLEEGNYSKAIAAFEKAIKIDPKEEEPYVELSDVYILLADDVLDKDNPSVEDYSQAMDYIAKAKEVLDSGKEYISSDLVDEQVTKVEESEQQYIEELRKYQEELIAEQEAAQAAAEAAAAQAVEEAEEMNREDLINLYGLGFSVGQIMPDFSFFDLSGNTVYLSDFLGRPLYINLYADWCPYCDYEMPDMQSTYEMYGSDSQFIMIGMGETPEAARQYANRFNVTIPTYYTYEWNLGDYVVEFVPQTFMLDKYGRIVDYKEGMADASWMHNAVENGIYSD